MTTYQKLKEMMPPFGGIIDYSVLLDIFPIFKGLSETPQDLFFHGEGDVWTHTKMVCDEIVTSSGYSLANDEEKFILFYSALWHDIGKIFCTREEDGKITSKGHSKVGAKEARIELWKCGVPFAIREDIVNIVAHHQSPFFLFSGKNKESPEFIVDSLSWKLPLNLLLQVSMADIRGRVFAKKNDVLDDIELVSELAKERKCLFEKKSFPDDFTRVRYFRSGGSIYPEVAFFCEKDFEVVVMCGLPASGKNTWVEKNLVGLPIISFDDTKEELGLSHGDNIGRAVHLTVDRAKELLRKKEPFVWNATNINEMMRKKTLDLLYSYGAKVKLVYLETDYDNLLERNNKRNSTISNKKIISMLYGWDVPTAYETEKILFDVDSNKTKRNLRIGR